MRHWSLIVAFLLLGAGSAVGQPVPGPPGGRAQADTADVGDPAYTSLRVREWTLDDGFPQPALDVAQTPDGYLWITTFDGLVRFDGVRFVTYTTANTPTFRSHDLVGLYASHSGDLWAGGRDGWVYRLRDGSWTAYDLTAFLPPHWVQTFAESADGTLWLASTGDIVARFDGTAWTLVPQRIRDVWAPFVADAEGTLWTLLPAEDAPGVPESPYVPRGGVVARWDGDRFVPASGSHLLGFISSQQGPLFHRTVGTSADMARDGRLRVEVLDAAGTLLGWFWTDGTPTYARLVDRTGRLWLQQEDDNGSPILLVVKDGGVVGRVQLANATWIEQVFEDAQGSVWVHARSTGLFQIQDEPFRRFDVDDGAPPFALRAEATPEGSVLVSAEWGTDGPSLTTFRDGTVTPETFRLDAPPPHLRADVDAGVVRVGHVLQDAQGQRWGIASRSLLRLSEGRADVAWSAGDRLLWTLDDDPADPHALWLGTRTGRVYRFDLAAATVTDSLDVASATHLVHRGPDGRLWVGFEGGLARLDDALRPQPVVHDALAGHAVRDLLNGPRGALWAATSAGLVRLRDGRVDVLRTDDGLPSDFLSMALLDDVGYLWLSGRQALYRLRLSAADSVLDGHAARLDAVTLLPSAGHLGTSNKLSQATKAPDGSLWIPSFKGVTRVDPAHYARQHAVPPPVHVEALRTEDGTAHPLTEGLRVPTGARTLTIEYTSTDFRAPGLVRFRTRLDGRDEAWMDQGAERHATYGGLAPGRYTFHVQAMNGGGVWSDVVATPAFVVPPRFTETGWFLLLCGLGLLAVSLAAYRLRVRTLLARQRSLNALVAARTRELEAEKETVAAQAEALRVLDVAKSRLFANVSHEFRTPLTLIIGPLEDVRSGLHGAVPEAVTRSVATALRNGRRLLRLVNQLLDVSRLEEGRLVLERRPVDLAAFARRFARAFEPLAERKQISFDVRTPSHPLPVLLDPEQFEKVLGNLLGNAFKFTPEGGQVVLALDALPGRPGAAVLRVSDDGPGIPPAHLPSLFERFYQADDSSTRRQAGTGIGLALVKNLVELHGGTVEVDSVVGQGTSFTVRLPRTSETALAGDDGSHPDVPAPHGNGFSDHTALDVGIDASADETEPSAADLPTGEGAITVLVADDNAEVRAYVRHHLGRRYRVLEAADGAVALALAREALPDLIVSDVMMPELDGFELVRALRADPELDFLPVILLTARASAESRLAGLDLGADAYLTKPFDVRELEIRVDNLIAAQQRLKRRFAASRAETVPAAPAREVADVASMAEDDPFLQAVRVAIADRLQDEDFSVDALAEAVGLGRTTLYRRLGEALGQTPMDLIWEMRLQRAAGLLREREGTVSEVAYGVGFKSVAHFCTRFREAYGCTPATYAEDEG